MLGIQLAIGEHPAKGEQANTEIGSGAHKWPVVRSGFRTGQGGAGAWMGVAESLPYVSPASPGRQVPFNNVGTL